MNRKRLVAMVATLGLTALLGACGSSQPGAVPAVRPTDSSAMAGMDHSNMAGMDHSNMPGMNHSSQTSTAEIPFDMTFIDGMIVHHEGAIVMAKQALESAERPEIRQLAEAIISAQQGEIEQMRSWRADWYPTLTTSPDIAMDMGPMVVAEGAEPFDQRFIQAMIPHHEAAILMARDALQSAEHPEIKTTAQAIISAQEAEIAQMRGWLKAWYGIDQ